MLNLEVANRADYRTYQIIAVSAVIVFPLCILKSVSSLRYASLLSIGAIAYTGIILVIELPFFMQHPELRGEMEWVKISPDFFTAFGITCFAFTCQPGFYSALDSLTKRDSAHKFKVTVYLLF